MASSSLGNFLGMAVALYTGQWWYFALQAGMTAAAKRQEVAARRRAVRDHNASVKDQLQMVDVLPRAFRTMALGRVRAVEGVRRRFTSGPNSEVLTMFVSLAGHEVDGIEQWYLDDLPVTLDAGGWVQTAPYKTSKPKDGAVATTLDGSGGAVVTLDPLVMPGTVHAVWATGEGTNLIQGTCAVALVGNVATLSGGQAGAPVNVSYAYGDFPSRVRIRPYLGAATQNVGADLAAEYPGELTSADKFAGIALAVVDVIYDPDVMPQGRPNVNAVFRGARVLDPRDGVTRWTENPALHAYAYATWRHGWAVPADEINTADVVAAANVCDASTVYTLDLAGGGTELHTLPRYRCGVVLSSEAGQDANMQDILQTMAGRVGWAGGVLRMRAGAMGSPVANITADWLVQEGEGDEAVISAVQAFTRAQRINRVEGACVDQAQRYQMLPYPAVEDAVLVAAKGERVQQLDFRGVAHIAHAQNLARIAIREAQAGLRLELRCGLQALQVQMGDVVTLTLDRFGIASKTFEVTGWKWTLRGAIALQLQETAAAIYDPTAPLTGRDPAPDSTLRRPWDVEALSGLAVSSGTTETLDGSVLTRTTVTWTAATGASIRQGGQVEIQYTPAGEALPVGDWPVWVESGNSAKAVIPGLTAGRHYLFKARFVQPLPLVRGAFSTPALHFVAPPPDANLFVLDLGLPGLVLPAAADGSVTSYAGAACTPRVLRSGADATASWTLARTNGPNVTSTFSAGVLTVTALATGAASGYIDVTATRSGYAPLTQRLTIAKGKAGADGDAGSPGASVYAATVYIVSSTAPGAPTGGSFDFATATITPPGGYSATRPAASTAGAVYAAEFRFASASPTATVTGGTWSVPAMVTPAIPAPAPVSPGPWPVNATGTATPTTCVSGVRFSRDGYTRKKASGTSTTYNVGAAWFSAPASAVGDAYYLHLAQVSLTDGTLAGLGDGLVLSSDRTVTLTATAGVVADAVVAYRVTTDAAGEQVAQSGQITLHAEST